LGTKHLLKWRRDPNPYLSITDLWFGVRASITLDKAVAENLENPSSEDLVTLALLDYKKNHDEKIKYKCNLLQDIH
jgi:hypothetical protein